MELKKPPGFWRWLGRNILDNVGNPTGNNCDNAALLGIAILVGGIVGSLAIGFFFIGPMALTINGVTIPLGLLLICYAEYLETHPC